MFFRTNNLLIRAQNSKSTQRQNYKNAGSEPLSPSLQIKNYLDANSGFKLGFPRPHPKISQKTETGKNCTYFDRPHLLIEYTQYRRFRRKLLHFHLQPTQTLFVFINAYNFRLCSKEETLRAQNYGLPVQHFP
jgi:hypothetical protein